MDVKFVTPKPGTVHKMQNGAPKLLNFSPKQITVLRGWPDPMAWRKTPTKPWRHVRPRITIPAADLDREIRLLSSDDDSQLLFDFAVDWHRKSALAWSRWFAAIPSEVREAISPYRNRHWHLMSFAARCQPAALDLLNSNPAIAYMLGSNWIFHRPAVRQPLRSARALLRRKQREILAWLGFPPTNATRKILRSIVQQSIEIAGLLYLRDSLTGPDSHIVHKHLAHLQRINRGVLRIVSDAELRPLASQNFLAEISENKAHDRRPETGWRLTDVCRMLRIIRPRMHVPVIRSLRHLAELHETLVEEINGIGGLGNVDACFPEPPFPGTREIIPVHNAMMLAEEGRQQENCVASYVGDILREKVYIYRVLRPERSTLSVVRKGHHWVLGQLAKTRNLPPSENAQRTVNSWLKRAQHRQNGSPRLKS